MMKAASCLLLASWAAAYAAADPASPDVSFTLNEDEQKFEVKPGGNGGNFTVKIKDMRSTGYQWFLDVISADITMLSNHTGGGQTEPPFILCTLQVSDSFKSGDVSWVHVKPWQMHDQNADRGHAILHVSTAGSAETRDILV
eukprot:TRINITY_DN24202_c0_g1_i1.p2 TRINITY_DN24202_c0_g1~~TRINITY_DN24202_c0_g1_i1.p2  ORF type:complete len:142 (+),score=42.44 TRINITY_DN24202_c0_g1_i1:97-522(+)